MTLLNLVTEKQYAELRGVCRRTVQRERRLRIGAPYIQVGQRILYRPEAINEWLLQLEKQSMQAATHSK